MIAVAGHVPGMTAPSLSRTHGTGEPGTAGVTEGMLLQFNDSQILSSQRISWRGFGLRFRSRVIDYMDPDPAPEPAFATCKQVQMDPSGTAGMPMGRTWLIVGMSDAGCPLSRCSIRPSMAPRRVLPRQCSSTKSGDGRAPEKSTCTPVC